MITKNRGRFKGFWDFLCGGVLVSCRAEATYFGDFTDFRCLFSFLPAVKATDFAGFPFFGCLLATILALKATYFGDFSDFGCLSFFAQKKNVFRHSF